MAFSAMLYNCSDDPRKAVKTLPEGIPVASIIPTESCDILNPTFILDYQDSYTTCNYIVVSSPFNRRYFINDMKISIGKKIEISCAVDVLSTYWNGIKENEVNVVRQENLTEPYLPDPEYKTFTDFVPDNYIAKGILGTDPRLYLSDPTFDTTKMTRCYVLCYNGGPYSGGGN